MRKGIAFGVAAALAVAAMMLGAFGVLIESGVRAHGSLDRYASAAAVVHGEQSVTYSTGSGDNKNSESRPLVEPNRVPLTQSGPLKAVPGVADVVADLSVPVVAAPTGQTLTGHGWDSAKLTPTTLTSGHAPASAKDVVLDTESAARLGIRAGSELQLQIDGSPQDYRVSGIDSGGPAGTLYFTQQQAETVSGHPDRADALVVLADAGSHVSSSALRHAAPGLDVATGAARGDIEHPGIQAGRADNIATGGTLGGVSLLVALLVVSGLLELSVRDRTRELAVMRAVGATPRQVRRVIVREMLKIAIPSALVGAVASLGLGAALLAVMSSQGVLPAGYHLALSPIPVAGSALLTVLTAVGIGWLSARRVSKIKPVQALGESAVEPKRQSRWRVITGLVFLALGAGMLVLTFTVGGQAASSSVAGLVISLMWGVALLGPWIARGGTRVLGALLRRLSPISGDLAATSARAAAVRMAAVITPIALALAFAGTQLFAQTTTSNATAAEARAGMRAERVLTSSGPGIPHGAYEAAKALPGVSDVTAVKRTTVLMPVWNLGTSLQSLSAQGVAGGSATTLDPKITAGSLAGLNEPGTVALSSQVAHDTKVGDTRQLWLGDGTQVTLKVVALYQRGFGFGDVLLPRDLVAAHAANTLDDFVLVNGNGDLSPLTSKFVGLHTATAADYGSALTEKSRHDGLTGLIAVVAIVGFILVGVVTTLGVATASRRRELTLLRLVGATRDQVMRALRLETVIIVGTGTVVGAAVAGVTLFAYAAGVTGLPMLSVPPLAVAGMVIAVAVPGAAAVLVPARRILRRGSPRIE
ncbi:ABC transporter permease [Catenulispora pinisilvae]|uniref:ABC transporter permease n=1 Tax=Catenulispora pinisilvae TaxID=2705253 RepID=UPI001890FA68|nr:ABC transporter permease [Catenulispora pinisilvae]